MSQKSSLPLTLKGFRDFLPAEALKRAWLKQKLETIFASWGYLPLETPTLEPLELFAGQIGEDEKLFFHFKDQGGRDVALRYDQTVPAGRVIGQYLNNPIKLPFKRYQIQPAFRAEKPQKGRYREFVQADCDIFGSSSPIADAEVIALSLDIYRQLGFKQATVLVNDRQLLKDLPYEAIVAIDKLAKIGRPAVITTMVNKGIDKNQAEKYLQTVEKLQPNDTIKTIFTYLKSQGFDESWYRFDPTIARSFSYSTGPIWEVVIDGFDSGSVLGGERFDQLVEKLTGIKVPATGFGMGFDRTLEAAEQFNLIPKFSTTTKVLVTIFSADLLTDSLKAAQTLRDKNINVDIYPDTETPLPKQLKYANDQKIPYVLIIGPDEAAKNEATLKDLSSGKQQTASLAKLTF